MSSLCRRNVEFRSQNGANTKRHTHTHTVQRYTLDKHTTLDINSVNATGNVLTLFTYSHRLPLIHVRVYTIIILQRNTHTHTRAHRSGQLLQLNVHHLSLKASTFLLRSGCLITDRLVISTRTRARTCGGRGCWYTCQALISSHPRRAEALLSLSSALSAAVCCIYSRLPRGTRWPTLTGGQPSKYQKHVSARTKLRKGSVERPVLVLCMWDTYRR